MSAAITVTGTVYCWTMSKNVFVFRALAEHFRKKKLTKTNVKELLEGKETLVKGIKNVTVKSPGA